MDEFDGLPWILHATAREWHARPLGAQENCAGSSVRAVLRSLRILGLVADFGSETRHSRRKFGLILL